MGGKQLGFSDYEQSTAKKRTKKEKFLADTPSARKVDASPSRPLFPPGGLMEQTNAPLQRGRQG